MLSDGHLMYQGPANYVGNYFDFATKFKSERRNPCDFFTSEMSISYPKTKEDDEKIALYIQKYERELKSSVLKEMQEL